MSTAKPMCIVEIGLLTLAMPAAKGLDLVKLLQGGAMRAEADYRTNYDVLKGQTYNVQPLPEIRLTTVDASRLKSAVQPPGASGKRTARPAALPAPIPVHGVDG